MSSREYDLDELYEVKETDFGYTLIKFTDTAAADTVVDGFARKYDSRTLSIDYLPGVDTGMRAEITKNDKSFTGVVYLGDDTVLATERESENLKEVAEEELEQ